MLDVLFKPTKVDVELVERSKEFAEGGTGGHLREGVDVLREALAAVATFAVGTGDVGVRVVDVAGEEAARVDLRPIRAHLLAILLHRIEVRHLIRAEDIVGILCDLCLERRHDGELLRGEDFDEQIHRARENHRLLLEVLDVCALGQELRHIANLMSRLL